MTRIKFCIPWDDGKNLGVAYNDHMARLNDGDWACFLDGDAMFLHPFFGRQLNEYIDRYRSNDQQRTNPQHNFD